MSRTSEKRNTSQKTNTGKAGQTSGSNRSGSAQNSKRGISSSELRVRHRPTARGITPREIDAHKTRGAASAKNNASDTLITRIITFFLNNRIYAIAGALLILIVLTILIATCCSGPKEEPQEEVQEQPVQQQQVVPQINLPKQTTAYVKTPSQFSIGEDNVLCIVLDPGHGGEDSGAWADELEEKDLTLRVAQYCKEELEKCPDIKVYLTRTGDYDMTLPERVEYAVSVDADLLVSLHIDNLDETTEHGATIYYPNSTNTWMIEQTVPLGKYAAECILSELIGLGLRSNGVREALLFHDTCSSEEEWERYRYDDGLDVTDYYAITRIARREGLPGLVVEHCYLSDERDTARLRFDSFVQALGQADARGILACFGYVPIEDIESQVISGFDDIITSPAEV
ncbi:MAG: N-acetylmuramoyl-L-alanine amidase [Coriobacteriales bacterium]|nr:N-acetylmuramoyl-L-alanine amidase [Coriobacteriales bacterium]